MRPVRSRGAGDDGATLVFVVLLLLTLVGFAAIAVDTAALVQERQTLQNGADAGVLAVAKLCIAKDDCDYLGADFEADHLADQLARENADDGQSEVEALCGRTGTGLDPCPARPAGVLPNADYATVTVLTETEDGSHEVPFKFAGVFGLGGQGVRRSATATWGPPTALETFPMAVAACDWGVATNTGNNYPPPPPYRWGTWPASEREVFYTRDAGDDCGFVSGRRGFVWLDDASGCDTQTRVGDWVGARRSRETPGSCDTDDLEDLRGTVVALPIYDERRGWGGDVDDDREVHISGYAAFYLTGYWLSGDDEWEPGEYRAASLRTGNYPCVGRWPYNTRTSCISGYFVDGQIYTEAAVGSGDRYGTFALDFVN